ncbi:MAG: TIR domain-containing protein [Bacteroidia bacterium]
MPKSIFISCVHEDAQHLSNLEKWAKNNLLGENVTITHETVDNRHHGYDAVFNHIRPRIEGASAVLVLVGQDTHNHDWIRAEAELANSYNKKIIIAQIPGTTGGTPQILKNKTAIPFDPNSIKKALL